MTRLTQLQRRAAQLAPKLKELAKSSVSLTLNAAQQEEQRHRAGKFSGYSGTVNPLPIMLFGLGISTAASTAFAEKSAVAGGTKPSIDGLSTPRGPLKRR